MKSGNRIRDLLRNVGVLATCGALILLVGVTFFGVITRYCLEDPFIWQEEVQLILVIWVIFLGGRYAFVYGNHAVIDAIVEILPKKLQRLLSVLAATAAVIILCYVDYQGVRYIIRMIRYDRVTNILKIPYSLTYAPLPIECLTMVVQACLDACRDLTGKGEEV